MSVICSINSRCQNFNLIKIDNNFLCLKCNSIFKKDKKILIKCCKNQMINHRTIIAYCINCYRFVYS